MRRTEALQGVRMAVFLNVLDRWESAELNQEEAAELLGVGERTFRRGTRRYEGEGEAGLLPGCLGFKGGAAGVGGGGRRGSLAGLFSSQRRRGSWRMRLRSRAARQRAFRMLESPA